MHPTIHELCIWFDKLKREGYDIHGGHTIISQLHKLLEHAHCVASTLYLLTIHVFYLAMENI